jgi:hypothetical protein
MGSNRARRRSGISRDAIAETGATVVIAATVVGTVSIATDGDIAGTAVADVAVGLAAVEAVAVAVAVAAPCSRGPQPGWEDPHVSPAVRRDRAHRRRRRPDTRRAARR